MDISLEIMQEIEKIKQDLGFDTIEKFASKTTNSIYFYLFKKSEYKFYHASFSLSKKKETTSGFFKIRFSDHMATKKADIDIISNGDKTCVFFNRQLIGGK